MLKQSLGRQLSDGPLWDLYHTYATVDDLAHLLQQEGGMEGQPLHGALHMCSMPFAPIPCMMPLMRRPCLGKVHDHL
jgi:hypothetical protein